MIKRKLVTMLATIIMVTGMLSGCGNSQSTEGGNSTQAISSDKILTMALINAISNWDPSIAYGADAQVFINTYELLLYVNKDGSYDPWLATSYESNETGDDWTFYLREGVKFHDGTDFTAEAVKFSYERTIETDRSATFIWDPLEEIVVVDDYTVELKLKYPSDIRQAVSCQYAAWIMSPSIGDDLKTSSEWFYQGNVNGTGPYMLKEYEAGSRLVLTKFEDYWGGWDGNHVETIVYRDIPESATRRQMLEGGEADCAFSISPTDMEALEGNEKIVEKAYQGTQNYLLFYNVEEGPTADKAVRQALAYTVPSEKIVNNLYYGKYATVPTDMLAASTQIGATKSIPYSFDLDKAKHMLKEAGYGDGFEITISVDSKDEDAKKACELWQSELANIGVSLIIEPNSGELVYNRAKSTDPKERANIHIQLTNADTSMASSSYQSSGMTGGPWNFSGFGDAQLDEKITEVGVLYATDEAAASELLSEVQATAVDECWCQNMFDICDLTARANNVEGFEMNPFYTRAPRAYLITKNN